jgi:hypothetical protein
VPFDISTKHCKHHPLNLIKNSGANFWAIFYKNIWSPCIGRLFTMGSFTGLAQIFRILFGGSARAAAL